MLILCSTDPVTMTLITIYKYVVFNKHRSLKM